MGNFLKRKKHQYFTTNFEEVKYVNVTCNSSLVGGCSHPSSYADHVPLYKLSPMF